MKNFLSYAKEQLLNGFFPEADKEIDLLNTLFEKSGSEKAELAFWEFKDNKMSYVAARKIAGLILFDESPNIFWDAVKTLMHSKNPFDRDTSFYTLCEISDDQKNELLRVFLNDDYLVFEAIDYFLKEKLYLSDMRMNLEALAQSSDIKIKSLASQKLSILNSIEK